MSENLEDETLNVDEEYMPFSMNLKDYEYMFNKMFIVSSKDKENKLIKVKNVNHLLKEILKKHNIKDDISFLDLSDILTSDLENGDLVIKENKTSLNDDILDHFNSENGEDRLKSFVNLVHGLRARNKFNQMLKLCVDNKDIDLLINLYTKYFECEINKENKGGYSTHYELTKMLEDLKDCRNGNFQESEVIRLKKLLDICLTFKERKFKEISNDWIRKIVQEKFWHNFDLKKELTTKLIEDEDKNEFSMKLIKINTKNMENFVLNNLEYHKNNNRYINNIKPELSKLCNFITRRFKKDNFRVNFLKEYNKNYEIILFAPDNENKDKNFKLIENCLSDMLDLIPILCSNKSEHNSDKVLINETDLLMKTWDKVYLNMILEKKDPKKTINKI